MPRPFPRTPEKRSEVANIMSTAILSEIYTGYRGAVIERPLIDAMQNEVVKCLSVFFDHLGVPLSVLLSSRPEVVITGQDMTINMVDRITMNRFSLHNWIILVLRGQYG